MIVESIKSALLAGIGLTMRTAERIEEMGSKIADEAKMNEEEGKKFVEDLKKESADAQKDLQKKIDTEVKKALDTTGIARKDELDELKKRLSDLESEVHGLKLTLGKMKKEA